MFRKFFIFALFATACGYVFASDNCFDSCSGVQQMPQQVWPSPGSEADVQYNLNGETPVENNNGNPQDVRIVSKTGTDLVVENNLNMGSKRGGASWSGGADLTHPYQAPSGFNIFESQAEMPLMHTEMMEDDGGSILAISRSNKSKEKNKEESKIVNANDNDVVVNTVSADNSNKFEVEEATSETSSEVLSDASGAKTVSVSPAPDQVRSWVVASGQTLREILQDWCDKEGWDLVWNTSREYPIQASAVFKGRFMDVSSALVRNFSRANPIPYAKFFKGNRVLVITTTEE
jgi:hypothetical protein